VVDVNKTPFFPRILSDAEAKVVDRRMAAAFNDLISRHHEADQ
jgi:hypothetical protein